MMSFKSLPIFSSIFLFISILFTSTNAATFNIRNNCPFTVWAGAVPGGGRQLDNGQTWDLDVPAGTTGGRIWPRTNCNFDGAGRGSCQTGDCNGLLQCQGYGSPPNTLAEFGLNGFQNLDFFDISLVDGFNTAMEFIPTSNGCTSGPTCTADINGQCPNELKAPGGCNNPCTVFKTDEYCCNSGNCEPTDFSRFFKTRCPTAYSYPKDDSTSTFTCPGGTNYRVVFCP
ncbi:hypothetical protein RJ640_018848 [Escallonia rubra]|uniref:Thaumatin-like protein n=1 Tax=Escallonia rubra TaxID=112253 RepID=A0AA88RG83_9ASTE|nr:hypothetical protein RJ640_018848 [Escallonia rubra]